MHLSFKTRQQHTDLASILDIWIAADEMPSIQGGWLFDHFYPIFSDPAGPCFEGWTLLSAIAARTSRLRLGVMVSSNTHRHPAVLTKMISTVDAVSEGRLEIGLGAGWSELEHRSYGIEFPGIAERLDRLEEACVVIDGLLTQESFSFDGTHYELHDARCEPGPVQRPRPPLLIGGRGERRTLRIVARHADRWNYPSGPVDDFRRKVDVLRQRCAEIGRDPAEIEITVQVDARAEPITVASRALQYAEAGAEHVILNLEPPYDAHELSVVVDATEAALGIGVD